MKRLSKALLSGTVGVGLVGGMGVGAFELLAEPYGPEARQCAADFDDRYTGEVVSEDQLPESCRRLTELITSRTTTISTVQADGAVNVDTETEYMIPAPEEFIALADMHDEDEKDSFYKASIVITALFSPLFAGTIHGLLSVRGIDNDQAPTEENCYNS